MAKISRARAFEDLVYVPCRAREQVPKACSVGEETARGDVAPKREDGGQADFGRDGGRASGLRYPENHLVRLGI